MSYDDIKKADEAELQAGIRAAFDEAAVDPDGYDVIAALKRHGLVIAREVDVRPYDRLSRLSAAEYRANEAEAKEARVAAAAAYGGAIAACQASVSDTGRSVGHHRCSRKPKLVIRVSRDPQGDGRLVVCTTHAKRNDTHRFVETNGYMASIVGPGAVEVVEAEYQP